VVVFTKFDKLVSRMEERLTSEELKNPEVLDNLCLQKAEAEFKHVCVDPLKKINPKIPYAKVSGEIFRFRGILISFIAYTFPFQWNYRTIRLYQI